MTAMDSRPASERPIPASGSPGGTNFSLAAAVRAALDETDLTDPHEIGRKIAESVPAKALRPALAEALSYMIRTQFGRDRMARLGPASPASSAKVAAFRADAERWRRALHVRVHVGGGQRLLLADLSYEHLRFAAQERREHAAANLSAAEFYERLAEQMQKHGAERVADLPDDVLRGSLDDGEAAS